MIAQTGRTQSLSGNPPIDGQEAVLQSTAEQQFMRGSHAFCHKHPTESLCRNAVDKGADGLHVHRLNEPNERRVQIGIARRG